MIHLAWTFPSKSTSSKYRFHTTECAHFPCQVQRVLISVFTQVTTTPPPQGQTVRLARDVASVPLLLRVWPVAQQPRLTWSW